MRLPDESSGAGWPAAAPPGAAGLSRRAVLAGALAAAGGVLLPAEPARADGERAALAGVAGQVVSWGSNGFGELGRGRGVAARPPGVIPGLSGIVGIFAGASTSFAVDRDGALWSWGLGALGRQRNGSDYRRPGRVHGLPPVRAVGVGLDHTLAVCRDGSVWSWGMNDLWQLGDGTRHDRTLPGRVPGLPPAVAVAAGETFSAALTADGRVFTWGNGDGGRLGNGSSISRRPYEVSELGPVVHISAGDDFVLAALRDGSVAGWGVNTLGQLGLGSIRPPVVRRPVAVPGIGRARTVAAGGRDAAVLNRIGRVKQWGSFRTSTPTFVERLEEITALAAGGHSTYALRADGRVLVSGFNYAMEFGRPTPAFSRRPLLVPDVTAARAIAAGQLHALALL